MNRREILSLSNDSAASFLSGFENQSGEYVLIIPDRLIRREIQVNHL